VPREVAWRFRAAMSREVARTRDHGAADRCNASGDQAGSFQSAEPDCRIEALGNEIDGGLGVGRVDAKLRMARGKLGKERGDVPQTERER